jgi:alkylation response protein AidB-like acyl-CoA dehydrogenase
MDYDLPLELVALSEQAHAVGRAAAGSLEVREDSWLRGTSRDFAVELASLGWLGMTWPSEYGGGDRTPLERFVVFEALISEGAPLASIWFSDRQIGPTLLQFGTDEQRNDLLPALVSGTSMWCVGMSEPDAGSDVASLRTRAERRGDLWVIDGQKVWTSGAADADWCYLIARTDPDAPPHAGLSEFLVDMATPGIEIRPIRDMSDDRHFCEVIFDGVEVPVERLVGTENGAFKQIMRQMEHERGGIDRLVSNRRLYLDILEIADRDDPLVRQDVARIEAGYTIGRHMVLREVLGEAPPGWSSVTKTWATEFE